MMTSQPPLGISVLPAELADEFITVEAFAAVVAPWAGLIHRLTLEMSGAHPLVEWVIKGLRVGSAHLDLTPVLIPKAPDEVEKAEIVRYEVPRILATGLERMEQGADPSEVFSPEAAEQARLLVRPLLSARIARIVVHTVEREIALTRFGAGQHEEPPLKLRSIASVEGELKAVSFSEARPFFSLYRRSGGRAIKCYFDERRFLDQVLASLRQRVVVSGRVSRTDDGTPLMVTDIRMIRRLGGEHLPQPGDLVGIEPELTDGLPSEVWLNRRRRG